MAADRMLIEAVTYLGAGVAAVPIAKRLGLDSSLGYLMAGVIAGPGVLDLIGGGESVMHVAEFGVVMMLFLVGLELQPLKLWAMRRMVFGLGLAQMAGAAVTIGLALRLLGWGFSAAVAAGLVLAMSSTAIALQALGEKGLLKTRIGETSFAILLFQDISVIPILALLPLLAVAPVTGMAEPSALAGLPGWGKALAVLGAVATITVGGRTALRPLFRFIAKTRLREIFTASALLLVTGAALLMEIVGLSPALGAFLAGVVLADSEFRHELESDVAPFKGLLLGLFFISVGAGIDFAVLRAHPGLVAGVLALLVILKAASLSGILRLLRMPVTDALFVGLTLSQGGEFAFVLIGFAASLGVFVGDVAGVLTIAVALSMVLTPFLLLGFERFYRRCGPVAVAPAVDFGPQPEPSGNVLIIGFGRMGQIVGRLLVGRGLSITVLEQDMEQIEALQNLGFKPFYGDARRVDLLHAAGAGTADLMIVVTDDQDTTSEIVESAHHHFPDLKIIARAYDRRHAYALEKLGASEVIRETFAGALEIGTAALRGLGVPAFEAERAGRLFRRHDLEGFHSLRAFRGDRQAYGLAFRARSEELARVLARDAQMPAAVGDDGWGVEGQLREAKGEGHHPVRAGERA